MDRRRDRGRAPAQRDVSPGCGDEEGVVCIPRHLATEIAEAAHEQEDLERFIQQEIENGAPLRGTYPPDAETLERYRVREAP